MCHMLVMCSVDLLCLSYQVVQMMEWGLKRPQKQLITIFASYLKVFNNTYYLFSIKYFGFSL